MWSWFPPAMLILAGTLAIITLRWSKARFGCAADRGDSVGAGRSIALLTGENDRLKGQVLRLEERVAVLERIATEPANRLSHEIEALR